MSIVSGWQRLTTSGKVASGPLMLKGVYINSTVSGSLVTLYNAQDTKDASQIVQLKTDGVGTKCVTFDGALFCERGLYVALGSGVTEVLVTWLPVSER